MKKILLLIDDMGQGGAERQMSYLAVLLKQAGYQIRLVRFYNNDSAYDSYLTENNVNLETIETGQKKIKRVLTIRRLIKKWNPDSVIVYKDGTAIASCIVRLFYKYKLIVSERNTTQKLTIYDKIKFFCYRLATFIVPNSHSQAEFLEKNFKELYEKVSIITNCIPMDRFKIAKQSDTLRVLTVARISPQKNVLNYLKAIKILKEEGIKARFSWFGRIHSEEYYIQVKELINNLSIEEYIEFYPEGSKNIEKEYAKSTHFCLPSFYEGFPNVLCEAMASGLICTASDICDNSLILNEEGLLFNPKDPSNIAKVIKTSLLMSSHDKQVMSERNRERIVSLCSPEKFVKSYIKLIEQ